MASNSQAGRLGRRELLRRAMGGAAAAAAGGFVVPAAALGAKRSGRLAPSERITIGMIGMGRQAVYANAPFFLNRLDAQVVAVCDVDAWRLDNAVKQVDGHYAKAGAAGAGASAGKGCAGYRDYRQLLAREDVDAVMISTPDHWHVPQSLDAVRAGKDVCCEKPLTLSVAEGRVLADTARRYGRVFRTDSEFRSQWYFHRACELVRNGRIGKLVRIETGVPRGDVGCKPQPVMPVPAELDYDLWLGPAPVAAYTVNRVHPVKGYGRPGWMRVRDYCDGMICNWGTHLNDIAQWGNGTDRTGPVEAEGRGEWPTEGGLWNVLVAFDVRYKYASGVELHYTMDRPYVRFEGTEGHIQADYGVGLGDVEPRSLLKEVIRPGEVHLPLMPEKTDFMAAIKTRGQTLADAEVGHRTNSLCHLGHISILLGRKLRWDPQAEQFVGDPEADRMLTRPLRSPWTL